MVFARFEIAVDGISGNCSKASIYFILDMGDEG